MSIPLSRTGAGPSPTDIPQNKQAATSPLDFMLVTSRADFESVGRKFNEECKAGGVIGTVVYMEDLPGNTINEKLERLQQVNASWQSKGFIAQSTIKAVLLHGDSVSLAPSTKADAGRHLMSISTPNLTFSTEAFDAAMRDITSKDGERSVGFSGTVIYDSCRVGSMRQAFKNSGGSYLLLAGMKNALAGDGVTCISDLIQESGRRKRENSAPLTGRECWLRASQLSGEHVAYIKGDVLEVCKVITADQASSPDETKLPAAEKIFHSVLAKLRHGATATVQRLFELWGPDAIRKAIQSCQDSDFDMLLVVGRTDRELIEKLQLLEQIGLGIPDAPDQLRACMLAAISHSREKLLSVLFQQCASGTRRLTPATFLDGLKAAPDAQTTLAKLCDEYPHLKQDFKDFMQSHANPQQHPLPFANLSPDLRRIAMAPSVEGLPQWLTDELVDYSVVPAGPSGQSATQVAFQVWQTLIGQKRFGDAHELLSVALWNAPDDMRSTLRERLPDVFTEARASRNLKLARTLVTLDHEMGLKLGFSMEGFGQG